MQGKMWGGRFSKKSNSDFELFSTSINYDFVLAKYDIFNSLIHVSALKNKGVLKAKEEKKITQLLWRIFTKVESGNWQFDAKAEDIHTNIQNNIEDQLGELGLKMHSLRSRNDQIAFDQQCYCCVQAAKVNNLLQELKQTFNTLGQKHRKESIIGYTHTRRAQIISLSDYFNCFGAMFNRDYKRLQGYRRRLYVEIGAGALAGNTISQSDYKQAINKWFPKVKKEIPELRKPVVSKNYLLQASERDFMAEFLHHLTLIQMHISRLAEDLILHSTKEFNYFNLPEAFCTGSSLMPHKENPDFLELLRGYTGDIYGRSFSLLTLLKSLPLSYNRDMQLDKTSLFPAVNIISKELKMLTTFLKGLKINKVHLKSQLEDESIYATEIAEFLVNQGVPFKLAHQVVGKLIRHSEDKGHSIKDMPQALLRKFHHKLKKEAITKIFDYKQAVKSRKR